MIEDNYPEITEFMDKCLYQGAAASMEEAISLYQLNGAEIVSSLLLEVDQILDASLDENELLEYIERHSDYIENDSALDTFKLVKNVLTNSTGDM